MAGRAALALVALALALGGCGGEAEKLGRRPADRPREPPRERPAAPPTLALGVNLGAPDEDIEAFATDAARAGVRLARADGQWESAEPTAPGPDGRHVYDWTFLDRVATALAGNGMDWWVVLAYVTPWAASSPATYPSPPRDVADYAAYAGAFARRYGDGGDFWAAHPELDARPVRTLEVWNEPDSKHFWKPTPDPARYAELYRAARRAIRAEDPKLRVLVGGLADGPEFVAGLRGRLGPQDIDGIALHAYDPPERILERVRAFRAAVRAAGLGDPEVPFTEFGWQDLKPERSDFASDELRARHLRATIRGLARAGCGTPAAFPFTWAERPGTGKAMGYDLNSGPSRAVLRELLADPPELAPRDRARCP